MSLLVKFQKLLNQKLYTFKGTSRYTKNKLKMEWRLLGSIYEYVHIEPILLAPYININSLIIDLACSVYDMFQKS